MKRMNFLKVTAFLLLPFFALGCTSSNDSDEKTPENQNTNTNTNTNTDPEVQEPQTPNVIEVEEDVLKVYVEEGTNLSGVSQKKFQFKISGVNIKAGDTVSFSFTPDSNTTSVTFRGVGSSEKWFDSVKLPAEVEESVTGTASSNKITKIDKQWFSAHLVPAKDESSALGFTFNIPNLPNGSEVVYIKDIRINDMVLSKEDFDSLYKVEEYVAAPNGIKSEFITVKTTVIEEQPQAQKICAAYISTWGVYDPIKDDDRAWKAKDIDGSLITDLILSFAELNDDDHVSLKTKQIEDYYEASEALVKKYPKLRISVAIGGSSEGVDDFKAMVADVSKRNTFVNNVKTLLKDHTYIRGIDIDWEYPGKRLKGDAWETEFKNYLALMSELKTMMNELGVSNGNSYRLTTALPADNKDIKNNIARIADVCDGLNLMMYDYKGSWSNKTGHNAPVDEVISDVNEFLKNGADPSKVILGIPFYGQKWTNVEEEDGNHGLGSSVTAYSGGNDYGIQYSKVLKLMEDENYVQYRDGKDPYLYNATDKVFVSYTDPQQIGYLIQFAREKNLGGVMTWEYGQDMTGTLLKEMAKF